MSEKKFISIFEFSTTFLSFHHTTLDFLHTNPLKHFLQGNRQSYNNNKYNIDIEDCWLGGESVFEHTADERTQVPRLPPFCKVFLQLAMYHQKFLASTFAWSHSNPNSGTQSSETFGTRSLVVGQSRRWLMERLPNILWKSLLWFLNGKGDYLFHFYRKNCRHHKQCTIPQTSRWTSF